MNSIVRFHQTEKDGKLFLEFNHILKTTSVEAARHNHRVQPHFLCPLSRCEKDISPEDHSGDYPLTTSYEYDITITQHKETSVDDDHPVLPLFWCNNKEFDSYGDCGVCRGSKFGIDYYFCEFHESKYHKECVESPLKIKHPYHPQHPLQLVFSLLTEECIRCGRIAKGMRYCCYICNAVMHTICAMQPIQFFIEKQKRHDHPLSFFNRQNSLVCNVCGWLSKIHLTYICVRCDFVVHNDCMSSPTIIKISRHHHRISYTSSLQSKNYFCGVCRQSIDGDYGAYICEKCSDYAAHSRCGLDKDVWDEKELDDVPDEDDLIEDVVPFEIISQGVIHHFLHDLHDHHLLLEVYKLYDETKLCQACVLPIYEGNFYSCKKCTFIIHDSCANAPHMIQHALHPHPLTLKDMCPRKEDKFWCFACRGCCDGFGYTCSVNECNFELDVRCASITEPFEFKDHEHTLFLTLNQEKRPTCQVCKEKCIKQFNCIKCDFIVCFKCASLPYKVRYKHDEHLLAILWGKEACEKDWCELCENDLTDVHKTKTFYSCKECCTFIHTGCLLGRNPYMKHDHPYKYKLF